MDTLNDGIDVFIASRASIIVDMNDFYLWHSYIVQVAWHHDACDIVQVCLVWGGIYQWEQLVDYIYWKFCKKN
jgi:hypothetical protein